MAWTTPKTWTSEPLTSLDLNTYMRDNQTHLKDRMDNSIDRFVSGKTQLSTSSTEYVDVDATRLALTLTTNGGDVLVGFTGTVLSHQVTGWTFLNLAVDGVDYVADDGICRAAAVRAGSQGHVPISFVILVTDLEAGSHTFKLRWKTSANNTSSIDVVKLHPQFWAKEL